MERVDLYRSGDAKWLCPSTPNCVSCARLVHHRLERLRAMTDESDNDQMEREDTAADTKVVIIVFVTAVVLAIHLISGFSFDF